MELVTDAVQTKDLLEPGLGSLRHLTRGDVSPQNSDTVPYAHSQILSGQCGILAQGVPRS
jgi:hypothetical protein